jgi:CRP/FNR family nitrogen fixation transcriptional regulator
MSRQDIGEYLGLTLETVSRTLAHLQATAAIEVHIRQIMLRDCSALRRLNA